MIEMELEELKRLRGHAKNKASFKTSVFSDKYQHEYKCLDNIIKLLESNAKALHKCKYCNSILFASTSKSFCSVNCRVAAHRQKIKTNKE